MWLGVELREWMTTKGGRAGEDGKLDKRKQLQDLSVFTGSKILVAL